MTSYQCNEGSFPLPSDEWQDRSMNIFQHSSNRFVLMVTRSEIPDGKTLKEELETQWEMLQKTVIIRKSEPIAEVSLTNHPQIKAYQREYSYTQNPQTLYQRQLTLELEDRKIMIFTQTSENEFNQEDSQYWQSIPQQLKLSN